MPSILRQHDQLLHIFLKPLWFHLQLIPLQLSNHSVQMLVVITSASNTHFVLADIGQRELEENRKKDGQTVASRECHQHHH